MPAEKSKNSLPSTSSMTMPRPRLGTSASLDPAHPRNGAIRAHDYCLNYSLDSAAAEPPNQVTEGSAWITAHFFGMGFHPHLDYTIRLIGARSVLCRVNRVFIRLEN